MHKNKHYKKVEYTILEVISHSQLLIATMLKPCKWLDAVIRMHKNVL